MTFSQACFNDFVQYFFAKSNLAGIKAPPKATVDSLSSSSVDFGQNELGLSAPNSPFCCPHLFSLALLSSFINFLAFALAL